MFIPRILKRNVFLSDRSTGTPEKFSIVVEVARPQTVSGAAAEDGLREAEAVFEDAQFIFDQLIASGALTTNRR